MTPVCAERSLRADLYIRSKMKAATLLVFVAVLTLAACRPEKSDLKQLKAEAARKKACMHDCGTVKFEPICAGKPGEKPKSFGNECIMNNHNCEHHDTLSKIKSGECPGSEGIRLS